MEPISQNPNNKPFEFSDKKLLSREGKTDGVSKKTKKIQESSHKKINATSNENNPKLERIAYQKILQKYKEAPEEPDISEENIHEISKALDQFILPLDQNSAFADTDLVLIHDSFTGNMPLNGIRKSELAHIEQVFKNICEGKEKIIILSDSTDPFKTDTENLIKILLTRNIGRKLIQKILVNPSITNLEIISGEESSLLPSKAGGNLKLELHTSANGFILAHHPSGKLKVQKIPLHVILAHELVHASHFPHLLDSSILPTFSDKYDEMEEQLTITGLKHDLSLENDKSEDDSWEPSKGFMQDLKENYDEINEWNISSAFTNSQDVYYPRFSHQGITLNNPLPLKVDDMDRLGELELKHLRDDIKVLVENGVLYDLEEMDRLNTIDIHKLFENEPIPLIFSSLLSRDVNTVRFLENKGFDVTPKSNDGLTAADYLFRSIPKNHILEYSDTIEFLIDKKISTHPAVDILISQFKEELKGVKEEQDQQRIEKCKKLMKLAFKDALRRPNFVIPFSLGMTKTERSAPKPSAENVEIIKILVDSAAENIKEFLSETHSADEYKKKGEHLYDISCKLQGARYDVTLLKDSISELYLKKKDL